ncbi:two-component system sensor histidine kinase/response regulator [Pleomorphomonas diazotrophica]|uniref:histidine kinase n=1 Tax=Pleomorphomonas diazotrophica TaxID=1166257 RepID=A0A1I4S7R9_9HYPH|nr:histidine kinase dimerization/phosphoacceptor domain -containing protein [Pleomorphomonas diazotrophica]PKR89884.1 two-component system sensor histidine kinase/response regulator [Pleomorphomonas diazotrophica]SFM60547.1 Two-component sensor histidine kinase, contains HisKA and HATPase domains [Pleomorphomonas diazotrophica]
MPYGTDLKEPIRVLHVEDDVALAALVRKALARRGHETVHVTTGNEALKLIAEGGIGVIALDHTLAAETGLDILARIGPRSARPPVVYVTGSMDARLAVEALKQGADDYVIKDASPEFFDLLIASLEQAFERWRLKTARARDQQLIREARDRAEMLLKEVNHRVANSLGLVAAMVRMQAAAVSDPHARHALEETQSRISAVAGVHRHLYTSDNIGEVDIGAYLTHLVGELSASLTGNGAHRMVKTNLIPISLPTDKAVTLGVMVGELVTNAFKYAYSPDASGEIRVHSRRLEGGRLLVCVEDDGIGWDGTGPAQGTGIGSKVLRAMARNLDAEISYSQTSPGTRVCIEFPDA